MGRQGFLPAAVRRQEAQAGHCSLTLTATDATGKSTASPALTFTIVGA
jgi:hypothetical protein